MFTTNNSSPNVVVIDNFYNNPDQIRKRALETHKQSSEWWKGRRSFPIPCEEIEHLIPTFERALGISLKDYNIRSQFHIHDKETPIVYHRDLQPWAAVIYLCPDAPLECGTSTWNRKNGVNLNTDPVLDGAWWDEIDRVGNVYNRCIIFNAKQIHSVSGYFGDSDDNRRLVQLFFFDNK